jgi:hypothetical protein
LRMKPTLQPRPQPAVGMEIESGERVAASAF